MTVTVYRRTLTVTISTSLVVDESKCSRSKFTLIYTLTVETDVLDLLRHARLPRDELYKYNK